MSLSKLPSGRWGSQVWDPVTGKNVRVSKILGSDYASFRTKTEAKAARELARAKLDALHTQAVTVAEFRERWLTDRLFRRPKQSTMIHNAERTKQFAAVHGALPMELVTDRVVAQWLNDPAVHGQVPALRAMWNDAASAKAGRVVAMNPWANLGLKQTRGRRDMQPPSEQTVAALVTHARRLVNPGFSAWLQVAAYTGMRPAEVDALRWTSVNFDAGRINVLEQFSSTSRTFTTPKNNLTRQAPLPGLARAALLALPREGEFCFPALQAPHWTSSSRAYHWKGVREAAGYTGDLYLATRHFAGWFMVNRLGLASEDVAIALGHTDGGQLVRTLYGHRDRDLALDRVNEAHGGAAEVASLDAARARKRDLG